MNRIESGGLAIPPVFARDEMYKMQPGQPIYEYYLDRRVESDIEYLETISSREDLFENFRMISIEYVLLSESDENLEQMKIEELRRVIDRVGLWGLVECVRSERVKTLG